MFFGGGFPGGGMGGGGPFGGMGGGWKKSKYHKLIQTKK